MASLLIYTFQDLYNVVARYLGTYGSSGPTGDELTVAKDLVNAGYLRFLSAFHWNFLRPIDNIITTSGVWEYELPEDFTSIIGSVHFAKDENYQWLMERDYGELLEMRAINEYTAFPEYFAIRQSEYTPQTGQRWLLALYPTPDAAFSLVFQYCISPVKLEGDNDVPIGTPDMSDAIRLCCLSEAEGTEEDLQILIQERRAVRAINDAIRMDNQRSPRSLGYMGDGSGISAAEITRGEFRINSVVYNTD